MRGKCACESDVAQGRFKARPRSVTVWGRRLDSVNVLSSGLAKRAAATLPIGLTVYEATADSSWPTSILPRRSIAISPASMSCFARLPSRPIATPLGAAWYGACPARPLRQEQQRRCCRSPRGVSACAHWRSPWISRVPRGPNECSRRSLRSGRWVHFGDSRR